MRFFSFKVMKLKNIELSGMSYFYLSWELLCCRYSYNPDPDSIVNIRNFSVLSLVVRIISLLLVGCLHWHFLRYQIKIKLICRLTKRPRSSINLDIHKTRVPHLKLSERYLSVRKKRQWS